jgi:integrase
VETSIVRRQRRKVLTDAMVRELKRKPKPYVVADPELGGHYVRVQPDGPPHRFYVIVRDRVGKQRWVKIGSTAEMTIEQAREIARAVMQRLKAGEEPFPPAPVKADTVADVVANYFKRYVKPRGIISAGEKRRIVDKHIIPAWATRAFADIRRSDIARLCDAVEDAHGPWVADTVLVEFTGIAGWYATRDDNYSVPTIKGMRRVSAQQRKRTHVPTDDQLRAIWKAAEASGTFGSMVQLLVLSGQRLDKVRTMKWADLSDSGVWTIPTAAREKGTGGTLQLPEAALKIIGRQPHIADNPYVFAGRNDGPLAWPDKLKTDLDQLSGVTSWRMHDCRRVARSLMSRAGVRPDVAERVLGHAVGSTQERIYDQHQYQTEKTNALQRLADMVDTIVSGTPDSNVVPYRAATQS